MAHYRKYPRDRQPSQRRANRPIHIGSATEAAVADLRFRMKVRRFHAQGARPLAEFLEELGNERAARFLIEAKLDRYLAVPDEALDATGARNFPPNPIHEATQ